VSPATRRTPCERHPEAHTGTCYCGRPASVHVEYGSGCGNVCAMHLAVLLELRPYVRFTSLEEAER